MSHCSVCSHSRVNEINRLLLAGLPRWQVEMFYFLSKDALGRHVRKHLHQEEGQ